ncbi:sulfatase-like hydrolase/transferase [Thiobacter aerophilum]|uniref:Sulfatase-like hydrolase/transferase n=1 Tax=Thiobacter aerophilum TaxID=3121275 RepID=A0ABV0EGR9_9BURK
MSDSMPGNGVKQLTILICTHNRATLLARALESLNAAKRPTGWRVDILVVANACTDDTHALLEREATRSIQDASVLPLSWFSEAQPGKVHALNAAIPRLRTADLVAFVDDDQRVAQDYLLAACRAADAWPQFSLFCGRIVPDWDGSEPPWVHTEGRYAIRPRPVPQSGWGSEPRELTPADGLPGGGVLALRGDVFDRVGAFSVKLGPRGHDLGGSEDADFLERAFALGERCRYVPDMLQYHHVDPKRLSIAYVLRKAFARSKTEIIRRRVRTGIAPYHWKKLSIYVLSALWPPTPARMRYYLVRLAATLGEMAGAHANRWRPAWRDGEIRRTRMFLVLMILSAASALAAGWQAAPRGMTQGILAVSLVAAGAALGLSLWSLRAFVMAGPRLPAEIIRRYRVQALLAQLRLTAWAFVIASLLAIPGVAMQHAVARWLGQGASLGGQLVAAFTSLVLLTGLQFLRQLLWLPANIAASYRYRISRLYPIWFRLTPTRLKGATMLAVGVPTAAALAMALGDALEGRLTAALAWLAGLSFYGLLALWLRPVEARPVTAVRREGPPNLLLLGCDTLRADRLDGSHTRNAAPFLLELSRRGVRFDGCFTPCARTAPSLLALLTGCWPARLGVGDNFVPDEATQLASPALPHMLRRCGYRTLALSDWCGADLGKFELGFERVDTPEDQWNISLFIRQGPKDLRLFLALFTHNAFGRRFLPEIFYLAGVPNTDFLGREARHLLSECAADERPFLLNVFFSTTHGPFGSEYPYYLRYAPRDYTGESKFALSRVTDPWEIIRRQAEPRTAFDLDQIIALYDGCVARFDEEVRAILAHLEACGLAHNTIIVLYSDHGMEFFEHGTWGQGNSVVSDASNRIPLVICGPGIAPRVVTEPVRAIDLAPTLLDLCGMAKREQAAMDGCSLVRLMRGQAGGAPREVLTETGIWLSRLPDMHPQHRLYPPLTELLTVRDFATGTISVKPEWESAVRLAKDRALRVGRWKLVCQPLEEGLLLRLFDMEADPECRFDCAAEHPELLRSLWHRLTTLAGQELAGNPIPSCMTGEAARG